MASIKNISFEMFYAVDENIRCQGYGSGILDMLQTLYPVNKFIETIERCIDNSPDLSDRISRRDFYKKNGINETGYKWHNPNRKS